MGEVRHLGEFGGLVPPPYRFVVVCLALLVVVCLAPLHSPYWGAATHLKYKKIKKERSFSRWVEEYLQDKNIYMY